MSKQTPYPTYSTYERLRRVPSVLSQHYPRPALTAGECYYPPNLPLAPYFATDEEYLRFGAESFCEFLADTIEVEHCVVIPAVAALRRIPYEVPPGPKQDLYKTATDEGFHAEQSLQFLSDLRVRFNSRAEVSCLPPLFLRRLEQQRLSEPNPTYRHLITILNGIVTETRISVELSQFAKDERLAEPVREVCRTHSEDEAVHSSQFRALGRWLWEEFDTATRADVARFLVDSTIARSLPDLDRFIDMLHRSTGRTLIDSERLVLSAYSGDMLLDEMLIAARPTIGFLRQLGVEEYVEFSDAVSEERRRLDKELDDRRKGREAASDRPRQ